jgi:hypothetical protein
VAVTNTVNNKAGGCKAVVIPDLLPDLHSGHLIRRATCGASAFVADAFRKAAHAGHPIYIVTINKFSKGDRDGQSEQAEHPRFVG